MTFFRVEFVLQTCREHLDRTETRGTPIDSIFAAYASAVIYAAFEQRIVEIATARATQGVADPETLRFVRGSARKTVRSIKVKELTGVAGRFSDEAKERFKANCTDEGKRAWDALAGNRHGLAHEEEENAEDFTQLSALTFSDVERNFSEAQSILDAFDKALGDGEDAPPNGKTG